MSQTLQFNGRLIDFDKLDDMVFDIGNICNSAVKVCRFNGHTKFHYSNLRHQFMVSCVCPHADLKLACLLHDVHEVVIGDLITPVVGHMEKLCPGFKEQLDKVKLQLDHVIARQFNCPELVDSEARKIIKYYDTQMNLVEAHYLLNNYWSVYDDPEIMVDYLKFESNARVIHNWRSKLRYLMNKRSSEEDAATDYQGEDITVPIDEYPNEITSESLGKWTHLEKPSRVIRMNLANNGRF